MPLLIHKMLLYSYEEDIKQISEGNTSPINLRKVAPLLKFQSMSIQMPSIATDNRKQFQSQNWTIMFGIQLMWKTFKLFKETAKSITKPHYTLVIWGFRYALLLLTLWKPTTLKIKQTKKRISNNQTKNIKI